MADKILNRQMIVQEEVYQPSRRKKVFLKRKTFPLRTDLTKEECREELVNFMAYQLEDTFKEIKSINEDQYIISVECRNFIIDVVDHIINDAKQRIEEKTLFKVMVTAFEQDEVGKYKIAYAFRDE